ncbi:MAG: AmmeMemoRadiSam system radical SAM enzyme [Candidatus Eremiobacteraeota bacterium]|nr:AmmeMemoRadiSam system radical SAM enzyme [Candidatus Eremiobacteraeota bacterium]
MSITRKEFINYAFAAGAGCFLGLGTTMLNGSGVFAGNKIRGITRGSPGGFYEASFYRTLENDSVECLLCPINEKLPYGIKSVCGVRFNGKGKMFLTNYARPAKIEVESVEQNPLYHYYPGIKTLAMGTAGCNLSCLSCQNWEISQKSVHQIKSYNITPMQAIRLSREKKCDGFSFRFSEPAIFFEYCRDIGKLANKRRMKTCIATSGYINPDPLKVWTKYIEAFTVSLKGLDPELYGGGKRPKVIETIGNSMRIIKQQERWLEVAILIIPGKSDSEEVISTQLKWIRNNLGEFIPIHFLKFIPAFKLDKTPETPIAVLENAQKMAKKIGIKYSYIPGIPGHKAGNTYCHQCSKLIIERSGSKVTQNHIKRGKCEYCSTNIPGVWGS